MSRWGRMSLVMVVVLVLLTTMPLLVTAQEEEVTRTGLRPDAPPYAVRGPYPVGTREFVIDPDAERPIALTVWYPALNPDGLEEIVSYEVYLGEEFPLMSFEGHALLDATPELMGAPYPLVVFSHGNGGNRTGALYVTEHLASHGFVVIGINHTGTAAADRFSSSPEDYQQNDIVGMIHRPLDITRVIDYATDLTAEEGELSGLIEAEQVAHMGHSYGGYVTLATGGAQLDYKAFAAWCDTTTTWGPHEHQMCYLIGHDEELASIVGLDAAPEGLWPSLGDSRIDALVGYSPGRIPAFGTDGLNALTLPMLVMVGSNDTDSPPERYSYPMVEQIGSTQKSLAVLEGADHYIFGDVCTAWMLDWGFFPYCSDDVWDMDRAHDLINHFTTAFLLDTLKGDADAHAALLAENVAFPGVTYETTME